MIETLVGPAESASELVAPRTAMTVHQRGRALIGHRLLNKDTGFSDAEREALNQMRERGAVSDEVFRRVERDLDLEELRMEA